MRNLTDEQRKLLSTKRNQVVTELLAMRSPCPGCMKPVTEADGEYHHAIFRASDSYVFDMDLLLLDSRNGVLAHHACHMKEGWDFQVRAALIIYNRCGLAPLTKYKKLLEQRCVASFAWPRHMDLVMVTIRQTRSAQSCPRCEAKALREYRNPALRIGAPIGRDPLEVKAICWNCLEVFPVGTILRDGRV